MDKVDFPIRLDKIDNSVASINVGVQNIQSRLDMVENNIKDELSSKLSEQLLKFKKHQNIITLALGCFMIISLAALLWNMGLLK